MKPDELGQPTIIVPYPGPCTDTGFQDIFVYLRPETNGVIAESTILKVVKAANQNQDAMKLIFLANIPGEFIVEHKIVEQYYALRLHFAVHGRPAFTRSMIKRFSDWYQVDFERVPVLGAFEALDTLGMEPEDLFNVWVDEKDVIQINGQIIKKIDRYYVVNYDIPALIHKNSRNTDIAIMLFRTSLGYAQVKSLVLNMHSALCTIGVLTPQFDAARAFHFSKSPLDQIMDGISYLYPATGGQLDLADFTFARWLLDRGYSPAKIAGYLLNPIVQWRNSAGQLLEDNLFALTLHQSYEEALVILNAVESQVPMINHGPILSRLLNLRD